MFRQLRKVRSRSTTPSSPSKSVKPLQSSSSSPSSKSCDTETQQYKTLASPGRPNTRQKLRYDTSPVKTVDYDNPACDRGKKKAEEDESVKLGTIELVIDDNDDGSDISFEWVKKFFQLP